MAATARCGTKSLRCLKARSLTLSLLALGSILLSGTVARTAHAQAISVPVDTSKATSQVPVATTFKAADGVWWSVSGTLTLKPIPAPVGTGELPPLPTPAKRVLVQIAPGLVWEMREGHLSGHGFGNVGQWSTLALAVQNREPWSWLSGEDFR